MLKLISLWRLLSMYFIQTKKFSSKNSSHTARIHVIKFYMNHLIIKKCFENKKNLRLIFIQIKKLEWQEFNSFQILVKQQNHEQGNSCKWLKNDLIFHWLVNLSLVSFQYFLFQTGYFHIKNIMKINTSDKVKQVKTLQLERMNQAIILSVQQRFLSIWKKTLVNFSKRRKFKILSKKHSEFVGYTINLCCEKNKGRKD
jgi:hypothetical protein